MKMKTKLFGHFQKQGLRVLLFAVSIFSIFPTFAQTFTVGGIYYDINGSEVTVLGCSESYSGDLIIPSSVTYNGSTYLVTTIGEQAFHGCTGLTSVNIPKTVTSIYRYAFLGCTGLTSVNITDIAAWCKIDFCLGWSAEPATANPLNYAHHLYLNGSEITNLVLPNSVTSISGYAFLGCTGLTSVNMGNSVTTIGGGAFKNCIGLNNVTITNSVTTIFGAAFYGCTGLTSITIPESVTVIGDQAFHGCTGLTSVTMENTVIGSGMFSNCTGLARVAIPNSVITIGNSAFSNCTGLTSVTIPNSVTSIGNSVFSGCSGLTSVTIPNSVTTINDKVFDGCTGLINVKLPKTLKSIGGSAFSGCSSLASVTIPNSVTTIGNYAFSASGLTNITIPNSVTNIGYSAFGNCRGLKSATITSHLTSIGGSAFSGCSALSSFTCMPEMPPIFENSSSFNTYNTTDLYVPRSGVENYKTHTNWRQFSKIYEFVGYFTVPDLNVSKGKTVVVPVSMTNEADIIGFQTDIYLPEGFEFVKDGADYVVDPSDRMAHDHAIMCNLSDDGALRVLCFSPTNKVISGNEGELFYVTIKAPSDTVGDFSLSFKNTILTTSDAEELLSPDAHSNINVISYLPGDANGNGEVSVIDIVTAAQYIIFQNPDPFLFEAADLNNDEQITVTDLALIANLILYPTMSTNSPLRIPALYSKEEYMDGDVQLNTGETHTVSITLDNVLDYTAFQMDINLPDGLTANNFQLTDRAGNHCLVESDENDGQIRVLGYSPALTAISGNEGALLTFNVTSSGDISGDITVEDIELVTTTCQTVHLNDFSISVNNTSAVHELNDVKVISSVDYYNLAGKRLDHPDSGVNIVIITYNDGSRITTKVIR